MTTLALSTPRLLIRPWTQADLDDLTALNADPEVNVWLGGENLAGHSAKALQAMQGRLEANGWGVLAICKADGGFLGLAGLQPVHGPLPVAPAVEAVWRLRRSAWGCGYAKEAMQAILAATPDRQEMAELVALIAEPNLRSARTALALGFRHDPQADFLHPRLAEGHPLRRHRVYRLRRPAAS